MEAVSETPDSVKANVAPALLIWARETAGREVRESAVAAGIDPQTLADAELGTAVISFNELQQLAAVYERPVAVFFLAHPPGDRHPAMSNADLIAWRDRLCGEENDDDVAELITEVLRLRERLREDDE
jgi:transcriptional regulator with XRE-family HTH domain